MSADSVAGVHTCSVKECSIVVHPHPLPVDLLQCMGNTV
jgi:hypothetical protein